MGAQVEVDHRRAVPQAVGGHLRRNAGLQRDGGVGVAKVKQSDRRHSIALGPAFEPAREALRKWPRPNRRLDPPEPGHDPRSPHPVHRADVMVTSQTSD